MADAAYMPRSSFASHVAAGRFGRQSGEAGVTATLMSGGASAVLIARRGRGDELARAVREHFGLALPDSPRWASGQSVRVQWDGPERWLLLFEAMPVDGVEAHLTSRLGAHASVVDQSHAHFRLQIAGPRVRDVLAKGFTIDLHERAMQPGAVALTAVAHIPVTLVQIDAAPRYEILGPRSSAGSFWHWLEAAAGAVGLIVETA